MQNKKVIDAAVASIAGRRPEGAAPNFGHRMAAHRSANRANSTHSPGKQTKGKIGVGGVNLNTVKPPKTSLPKPQSPGKTAVPMGERDSSGSGHTINIRIGR